MILFDFPLKSSNKKGNKIRLNFLKNNVIVSVMNRCNSLWDNDLAFCLPNGQDAVPRTVNHWVRGSNPRGGVKIANGNPFFIFGKKFNTLSKLADSKGSARRRKSRHGWRRQG
jgi:hypothetical protein